MIIDSFSSMPYSQTVDIKLEKKSEAEEPRAIEDSGESENSRLDIDRQNVAKKTDDFTKDRDNEPDTYNAKGDLAKKMPSEDVTDSRQGSVDLVV